MSLDDGELITEARARRLQGSIPTSYTIFKVGSNYYAETNVPGAAEISPLTNAATVINNALAVAIEGMKVVVKSCDYGTLDTTITVPNNRVFMGESRYTTLTFASGVDGITVAGSVGTPARKITVKNFNIINAKYGLNVSYAQNDCHFSNLYIGDPSQMGVRIYGGCWNIDFDRIFLNGAVAGGNSEYGVYAEKASAAVTNNNISFTRVDISNITNQLLIEGGTHNVVERCGFHTSTAGYGVYLNGDQTNNNKIISNYFENVKWGVKLLGETGGGEVTDENLIADNYFKGSTNGVRGIHIQNYADYTVIRDNMFVDWTTASIQIDANANYTKLLGYNHLWTGAGAVTDAGTGTKFPTMYVPSFYDDTDANISKGNIGDHFALALADNQDTTFRFNFKVPEDFQQLIRARLVIVPAGTGNLRRSVATDWGASTEDYNNGSDSIAAGEVAVTQNKVTLLDLNSALDGIAANDHVGVAFTRAGSHGNDTVGATVYALKFWMQYV